MRNKAMLWIFVLLILSAKALAIGIGTPYEVLQPQGTREVEFYVINDEHKDMRVQVSVSGALQDNILFSSNEISLSAAEELKKITATITFPSEIIGPTKIILSDVSGEGGQIMAVAHVSYTLKIEGEKAAPQARDVSHTYQNQAGNSSSPKPDTPSSKVIEKNIEGQKQAKLQYARGELLTGTEKNILWNFGEKERMIVKEIASLYKPFPAAVLLALIVILIISSDVLLLSGRKKPKNKNPLSDYIANQRELGRAEGEIKSKLAEAGWQNSDIEEALRK